MTKKIFFASLMTIAACFVFTSTAFADEQLQDDIQTNIQNCYSVTSGECRQNNYSCYRTGRYFACKQESNSPNLPSGMQACVVYRTSQSTLPRDEESYNEVVRFCHEANASMPIVDETQEQQPNNQQEQTPSNENNANESTYHDSSSADVFSGSCRYVLGLTSWDCGVNISDEESLKSSIWQIALNVLANISVIAAYLVLGYIIYGGYLYTMSGGSADKILAGKKTLTRAFTGLAIVVLANAIMNTIRFVLIGANGNFLNCVTSEGCVNPTSMITNTIHWTIAIASIVAVIFVIYGGVSLMTSSGDPGKVKKAKDMILYSTIGLIVTALAEIITAFVSNIINNAS